MASPTLRDQAHHLGMGDALRAVSAHSEQTFQRHIEFILARLEEPDSDPPEASDNGEEAEADEFDEMVYEEEYDEIEEVMQSGALQR